MSRVLKYGNNRITNGYAQHTGWSKGVDIVKAPSNLDYITAHTAGTVIKTMVGQVNGKLDPEGYGYGNYIMIEHQNGLSTLYAHLKDVYVSEGDNVSSGTTIGYMGNTGNSYGAHLHFELRKYDVNPSALTGNRLHDTNKFSWMDPTPYLDSNLPGYETKVLYRVQTNAFKTKFFAKREVNRLKALGYSPITKLYADGMIHVQTNAYEDRTNAEIEVKQLMAKNIKAIITTENGRDIVI